MKKSYIILLIFSFLTLQFVSSQDKVTMKQVVESHDIAMKKMPELAKLSSVLKRQLDSTKTNTKYHVAIDELKASNKAMVSWMQGFGERFTADEMMNGKALSEEKQLWLVEEEHKINALNKRIDASLKQAKGLLVD